MMQEPEHMTEMMPMCHEMMRIFILPSEWAEPLSLTQNNHMDTFAGM